MATVVEQCKTCRCSKQTPLAGGGVQLQCRFEPPKILPMPQPQGMAYTAMWPGVEPDHWCSKWQQDQVLVREPRN